MLPLIVIYHYRIFLYTCTIAVWEGNLHLGNFHSIVVNIVLFCSFFFIFFSLSFWFLLCPTLYCFFSWMALFPFFLSIVIFTFLPRLLSPFFPPPLLRCVFLLTLWWVLQLALLQYRLNMSSMLCQPPAPPGSGTLQTYQVLLPFHSGFLEVNLRGFFHCTFHGYQQSAILLLFLILLKN